MDCLEFAKSILDSKVDLIYIDPPFFTNRTFKDYNDSWSNSKEYLLWLNPILKECHRVLKSSGSIYVHCDWHINYGIRVLLEKIFKNGLINEIAWCYKGGNSKKRYRQKHDTIYIFSKSDKYIFNYDDVRITYSEAILKGAKTDTEGRLYYQTGQNSSGKVYLHDKGQLLYDYWLDIPSTTTSHGKEFIGYDTQKPEKLLERVIRCSSDEGDVVMDCFLGSGTTAVVAKKLNRKYLGCDSNPRSIEISSKRLSYIEDN